MPVGVTLELTRIRVDPQAGIVPEGAWPVDAQSAQIMREGDPYAIRLHNSIDKPLYATATTGLYPETLFDGQPLFAPGKTPDAHSRARYLDDIWHPYHNRIGAELTRLKAEHGHAVLFDAHSIKGYVPRLFDGQLPDFNIGTNEGKSCAPALTAELARTCDVPGYSHVVNGRFKGGHITRHYGAPAEGVHAIQLELAQRTYMREEPPFDYQAGLASRVQAVLARFVETMINWRPT